MIKPDLAYDLLHHHVFTHKCTNRVYAQHLYAALCNNRFTKNEVFPILAELRWTCTWEEAANIVASIRNQPDKANHFYLSGSRGQATLSEEQIEQLTPEQLELYEEAKYTLPEGMVTKEIEMDLFGLGWIIISGK